MTNPPPPPLDLGELKRLVAEATPPPWFRGAFIDHATQAHCFYILAPKRSFPIAIVRSDNQDGGLAPPLKQADVASELIVVAVNSLPALIAEVERLRAGLAEMTNAYRDARRLLDSAERYHRQGDGTCPFELTFSLEINLQDQEPSA